MSVCYIVEPNSFLCNFSIYISCQLPAFVTEALSEAFNVNLLTAMLMSIEQQSGREKPWLVTLLAFDPWMLMLDVSHCSNFNFNLFQIHKMLIFVGK